MVSKLIYPSDRTDSEWLEWRGREGAASLLSECSFIYHWLACIWADSGSTGALVA